MYNYRCSNKIHQAVKCPTEKRKSTLFNRDFSLITQSIYLSVLFVLITEYSHSKQGVLLIKGNKSIKDRSKFIRKISLIELEY